MIRKLLATTAIVTIAAGTAFAAEAPAATYLPDIGDAALASQWIGETVYSSDASNAETIGEINDLVVGMDGKIDAAIIGVGGFLGVGEKDVAVSFDSLRLSAKDGDRYVVLPTTKEALEQAPTFDVHAAADQAPGAPAPSTTAMKPASAPDVSSPAPAAGMAANPGPGATSPAEPRTTPLAEAPATPQRDTLQTVQPASISSADMIGAKLYSAADESIGSVSEVVLTPDGAVDAVIVDVGGFLGIGAKSVALSFSDLDFRKDENGRLYVYTGYTQDQLESAPAYVKDAFDQNRDTMLLKAGK